MSTSDENGALVPAARVQVREDGGEVFLLHLDTGRFHALNRTGGVVWRALETGADPVAAVQERFPDEPAEQVRADVAAVVQRLRDAQLVTPRP